jgi:hypothetical protein
MERRKAEGIDGTFGPIQENDVLAANRSIAKKIYADLQPDYTASGSLPPASKNFFKHASGEG